MASIGQIKLPDNNNYNLSVPFVIGTGSTAGTWLGTLTGLTAYYDGLLILYKPSVAGATTTTLNLNNLGAKTCYVNNTTKLTTHFPKNQPILLVYSSSQNSGSWLCLDNYWTDTIPAAQCTTAAATAAKYASCSYYTATANTYTHVNFRYANSFAGAITLNINGQGAKPIYINGTASSDTNRSLPAGSYLAFYDGTNYYFRTDGKLTADITGDAETVNGHTVEKDVPSNAVLDGYTKSEVNTALSMKVNTTTINEYVVRSSQYATVWGVGSYATLLVIGFAQGIGPVALCIQINNNVLKTYSLLNGAAWSSSYLSFVYNSSNKYMNIYSTVSAESRFTVIRGGLTS